MGTARSHGIEIHYEATGDGPAIVLLHSFLCSGAMWEPQVGPLSRRCRTLNVDLRGHGRSGPIEEEFDLYDMVDDAVAVLDREGVEKAVWAGLSVGGMVALRAALVRPERVAGLALLDTDAGPEKRGVTLKYRLLGAVARWLGLGPVMPQVTKQMFGRTTLRERPELVRQWVERFRGVHVPSMLRMLTALVRRDDLTARLGSIAVPALVLVGEEDASLPPQRSRRLAAALPEARLVEVPAAGHLASLEQPEAVSAALLGFLDRLREPAA